MFYKRGGLAGLEAGTLCSNLSRKEREDCKQETQSFETVTDVVRLFTRVPRYCYGGYFST